MSVHTSERPADAGHGQDLLGNRLRLDFRIKHGLGLGGLATFALLIALAPPFMLHDWAPGSELAFTLIVALSGMAVGLLIGFLASPYSSSEDKRFSQYASILSAFISGYAVSQLQPWIEEFVRQGTENALPIARLLLFTAEATTCAIMMYDFRVNLPRPPLDHDLRTRMLRCALEAHGGDREATAKHLGISVEELERLSVEGLKGPDDPISPTP